MSHSRRHLLIRGGLLAAGALLPRQMRSAAAEERGIVFVAAGNPRLDEIRRGYGDFSVLAGWRAEWLTTSLPGLHAWLAASTPPAALALVGPIRASTRVAISYAEQQGIPVLLVGACATHSGIANDGLDSRPYLQGWLASALLYNALRRGRPSQSINTRFRA